MKREDINYFNSWAKCFRKASPAQVMQAIIDGIWISSNKDPEDIYLVFPKLIVRSYREIAEVDKKFGLCPFEFSIEDGETYRWEKAGDKHAHKGRDINMFGTNWHLDKYEMRKAVTRTGLELAEHYKITKDEIVALHKKYGWDDDAMYKELIGSYQQTLNSFVGPTEVLICGDTLQLKDYSKTDWPWTMFNPEAKQKRHDTVFPEECKKAFEMGARLFK